MRECRPVFQHEYALSKLKQAGIKLAVASNSITSTVELMMRMANLEGYLEFCLSNEDVAKPKPSPEIYEKAIKKLGFSSSEVLVVEDNDHGIEAAMGSGAHLMRVNSPKDVTLDAIQARIRQLEGEVGA
jgi:HAD superfamily hydrolase (TIGR01509 family)